MIIVLVLCIFFFKQKTAYEMRISDWSSDVCSSDLRVRGLFWFFAVAGIAAAVHFHGCWRRGPVDRHHRSATRLDAEGHAGAQRGRIRATARYAGDRPYLQPDRQRRHRWQHGLARRQRDHRNAADPVDATERRQEENTPKLQS